MKAISLWQPWASAVALGLKQIETRHWWTPYRGPLAIHAAQHGAKKGYCEQREFYTWQACEPLRKPYPTFDDLPFGAVLATCRLVECLRTIDVDCLSDQERAFGDYTPGRYAWVFQDIKALPAPVPFRGAQSLFEWPTDQDPQPEPTLF